jgi:RNA polymerase sigma factor (sigma-70 family)
VPALDDAELRELAAAACRGDARALEALLVALQDDVYRLALRMLWHPQDAEDATQEALIRIMTRIGAYRGEAAVRTWAYRVAANHILNWRQSRVERENLNFRRFASQLHDGLEDPDPRAPDTELLTQEIKLGCTLGMLLCLDRDHRIAYVLTDVLHLSGQDAAFICDVHPATLRKRASRARARLQHFVSAHCGLVNQSAPCRCDRRITAASKTGRARRDELLFSNQIDAAGSVAEMERLHDLGALMTSHPDYEAPGAVIRAVRQAIASGHFTVLE